ncbi:MAG: cation:proton antiporter [Burkholderiaceae bacterium]
MSFSEILLIAMLMVFSIPYLIWRLGGTDYYAPLVVVQILAGIALGPGVLGAAFPDYYRFVFTAEVEQALSGVAQWSVMIFVWIAGVELDLRQAWRDRRESGITAGLALGVPLVLGMLAGALLLAWPGWIGPNAQPWQFLLGIGMSCAVTALPILILLMEKLRMLREPLGQRILRYASLDDIAIWGVLAVILMDWARVGKQIAFFVVFAISALLFRRLMRAIPLADRWYASLVWLLACGLGSDWAGLHYMVGAFLAGAVIDADWLGQDDMDRLRHNLLLIVMPVYFLNTGLRTDWQTGGVAVLAAAALLLVVSVAGKLLGMRIAGRLLGWSARETRVIGWLLQTKALIMIVFSNVLLDKGLITNATFTALLLMAVASTMMTIPRVTADLKRMGVGGTGAPGG